MSIEQGLRRLTEATRERIPEMYEEIRRRLRTEAHPGTTENLALSTAESATIYTSLNDALSHISDMQTSRTRASNEALREARVSVQVGVGLYNVLHGSRIGQSVLWSFLLDEAYRVLPDGTERAAVLRHASARHFSWNDEVSNAIVEAYQQQSAAFALQSSERRRLAVVNALLAGLPVDTAVLEYALRADHLALIVSGANAEVAARGLAQTLGGASRPLIVSPSKETAFMWIQWSRRVAMPRIELDSVSAGPAVRIAYGTLSEGPEGFRISHRQAAQADRVGAALSVPVTWYEDVALEAMALNDVAAARAFVREELHLLGDVDDPANVLVETLRAYFVNGENAVLTAQELDVHPRTVAYRLRSAEAKLGLECLRRGEFAVALRLRRLVSRLPAEGETGYNPGLPTPAL